MLQSTTPVFCVLEITIPYHQAQLQYHFVLLQYYSVLQSTIPILLCTAKHRFEIQSSTFIPILLQYHTVLLRSTKYHSVLQSPTPVVQATTPGLASTRTSKH